MVGGADVSPQENELAANFMARVQDFRSWADAWGSDQEKETSGCWECNYEGWNRLYDAAEAFFRMRPFHSWTAGELEAVLYALARDEDGRTLSRTVREVSPTLLVDLAESGVARGERNARWQMADELARIGDEGGRRDAALLRLADDPDEYVRRRAMSSLLALRHPAVERLAIESWRRPQDDEWAQLFARQMVLHVLDEVASVQLPRFLDEADRDGRPDLVAAAAEIRVRHAGV
jgi:hypothetical protein